MEDKNELNTVMINSRLLNDFLKNNIEKWK